MNQLCYTMADIHSAAVRSFNMSRIKGKNTKTEMQVRRFLHARGFRYRLHDKKLAGKGAKLCWRVVLKKRDEFFFEGFGEFVFCKTRTEWWLNKINGNIANDAKAVKALKKEGWKIIEV